MDAHEQQFLSLIEAHISQFLSPQSQAPFPSGAPFHNSQIMNAARREEFFTPLTNLIKGGKRTRARFVYAGFHLISQESSSDIREALSFLGAAIEMLHLSALIHDDFIDHSELRRGIPAAHMAFQKIYAQKMCLLANEEGESKANVKPAKDFGAGASIILGNYVNACAYYALGQALSSLSSLYRNRVSTLFTDTFTTVNIGQYLDICAEAFPLRERDTARAYEVIDFKTVSYSVLSPLLLGAYYAAGREEIELEETVIEELTQFSHSLGRAYQLKDDHLNIFGCPKETGKPQAGDIFEGKQTVLRSLARNRLSEKENEWLDSLRDNSSLSFTERQEMGARVAHLFTSRGVEEASQQAIDEYESLAHLQLSHMEARVADGIYCENGIRHLRELFNALHIRQS